LISAALLDDEWCLSEVLDGTWAREINGDVGPAFDFLG
jgi:hypothetical protein